MNVAEEYSDATKYGIWVIDNLLTDEECDNCVSTMQKRMKPILSSHNKKHADVSYQQFTTTPILEPLIRERVTTFAASFDLSKLSKDAANWELYDRVRIVHYISGQEKTIHRDTKVRFNGKTVKYICIVYLNDDYSEGETISYPDFTEQYRSDQLIIRFSDAEVATILESENRVVVSPKKGRVVLYDADIIHRGTKVDGEKWLLIYRFAC